MNVSFRLLMGTLAFGLVTGLHAQETSSIPAIVFCKARILPSGFMGETILSVSLPATEGFMDRDGNPVTVWNPGDVVAGGVADSWHDGGPGYFTARNTGNVGAFLYVVALNGWGEHRIYDQYDNVIFNANGLSQTAEFLFNEPMKSPLNPRPTVRPDFNISDWSFSYHLALTTDTDARAPTWRSLDHVCNLWDFDYSVNDPFDFYGNINCSAYLNYVAAGDYQPFDLKFWAPPENFMPAPGGEQVFFYFSVEASSFPRWEHDR